MFKRTRRGADSGQGNPSRSDDDPSRSTPNTLQATVPNPEPSRTTSSTARLPAATGSRIPRWRGSSTRPASRPAAFQPTSMAAKSKQGIAGSAWSGLKALIGVLNKSADVFPPLKSAVVGLWESVEVFENEAAARNEYQKLRTDLDNLCNDISAYIGGDIPPSMTPSIVILAQYVKRSTCGAKLTARHRGIEEEIQVVMQKGRRNVVGRYAEAMEDANEVLECYRRIQTLLNRISLNANMRMWRVVDEEAARNRLEKLPKSMEAKYSSAKSDSLGRNGCTPDTRVGVLKLLRHWAHDCKGKKIYWLNGMAGTGKTTIAYSLCEQLERDGQLAANFFCSRQLPSCRDVSLILPTIAYQLSLFSHPYQYASSNALKLNPELHNQPTSKQVKDLIAAPLLEVQETLPANMVMVIDALDECEDADGVGRMLFALLAEAPNLPIKVFVASRPYPKILKQMESEQGERVRSELRLHELARSVVLSDIKTYLASELDELMLQPAQLDMLAERSTALFIYASTVVRYVKQDHLARSLQRMTLVLSTSNLSNHGYKAIDKLYENILVTALLDEGLETSERDDMMRVLRTVICAQEPLSVEAIAGLLQMKHADAVHATLQSLLSVLRVSSETGLVTTLHKSFPDYLFDKERSDRFYCDAKQHHTWLAQACLAHIRSVKLAFNICDLDSSFVPDEEVSGIRDKIRFNIPDHIFYAYRYWLAHMELAESAADAMHDLFWFLSERILLWMEIMNLKQVVKSGASILSQLHRWLS
ncbi:hypothetical protein FRC07_007409, partial [Ceratobasidium sp. 392]